MLDPRSPRTLREHDAVCVAAATLVLEPVLAAVLGLYGEQDIRVLHSTRTCLKLCLDLRGGMAGGELAVGVDGSYLARWCDRVHTVVIESQAFTTRRDKVATTQVGASVATGTEVLQSLQLAVLVSAAGRVASGEGDQVRNLARLCVLAREGHLLPVDEPLLWMMAAARPTACSGEWFDTRVRNAAIIAPDSLLTQVWAQGRKDTLWANPRDLVEPSPS